MLKSSLDDPEKLYNEAKIMHRSGAELIRCAIPRGEYAAKLYGILKDLKIPLIADCHFQYSIALKAIEAGFNKIRLNPGNMTKVGMEKAIKLAKKYGIAVRLGFNTGSCSANTGEELAELALKWDKWVREFNFDNFLVSMKSSSVIDTVTANRYFSIHSDTPLHIGVTATGPQAEGVVKSSMGIGALLLDGIGDTMRVSLTEDSELEVKVAISLRDYSSPKSSRLEIISCPSCSRKRFDVKRIVSKFMNYMPPEYYKKQVRVAIMGCEVNGPGEARACDIGICGTAKGGLLLKKGKVVTRLSSKEMVDKLLEELKEL